MTDLRTCFGIYPRSAFYRFPLLSDVQGLLNFGPIIGNFMGFQEMNSDHLGTPYIGCLGQKRGWGKAQKVSFFEASLIGLGNAAPGLVEALGITKIRGISGQYV